MVGEVKFGVNTGEETETWRGEKTQQEIVVKNGISVL